MQIEWHLPNRRLKGPDNLDPSLASKHLVTHTSRHPGRVLEFDDEARNYFDSFGVAFNTRVVGFRKVQNADSAAEEGTTRAMSCMHCRPCGVCYARRTSAL